MQNLHTSKMSYLTRSSFHVLVEVGCMVLLLLSCLAKAEQFDSTFDPITRRGLSGHHPTGEGHHPPGEGHHPPGEGHHPPGEAPHPRGQGHHPGEAAGTNTTPAPEGAKITPSLQPAGQAPPDTTNYNVIDVSKCPGAIGDGKTDATRAFMKAWEDTCKSPTPAKFLVPKGTWLTAELDFRGPCAAPKVLMEIQGTMLAKPDQQSFPKGYWINVMGVEHFTLNGGGIINAQGERIWHTRALGEKGKPLPDSLVLAQSNNSRIENINLVNGKGFNMKVYEIENVTVTNMNITSPDESPNTDGIHIGRLKNFQITDSVIGVGDDCVSIGDGSIDILVRNITCGPGHGISIGSLGRFAYETDVRNVWIENCSFTRTLFGARIKTFHDSPAIAATNITYTNLVMNEVYSPIIIDQNYAISKPNPSRVKLSNIKFTNVRGTTWSNIAVSLNCSSSVPCQAIELKDIDLKYTGNHTEDRVAHSACAHANVKFGGIMNPPGCKL